MLPHTSHDRLTTSSSMPAPPRFRSPVNSTHSPSPSQFQAQSTQQSQSRTRSPAQNHVTGSTASSSPAIDRFGGRMQDPRSVKRIRVDASRTSMSYPRKRAVTACQLCRMRKTKCSNGRPKCDSCTDTGAECVYEDRLSHSSFDPASLLILDRLNHLVDRFDAVAAAALPGAATDVVQPNHASSPSSALRCAEFSEAINPSLATNGLVRPSDENEIALDPNEEDYMRIPSSRTSCDTVLCWPVFGGRYPANHLLEALLSTGCDSELDAGDGLEACGAGNTAQSVGVGRQNIALVNAGIVSISVEENVTRLVDNFITLVHIKNPILDISTLNKYARSVAEYGLRWDGASCLVLLTCALGAIAKPFPTSHCTSSQSPDADVNSPTSLATSARDLHLSAHYYSLARKRIGLLGSTIIRSQCYLLSGIYLMYTLRPLEAWHNFVQASTTYYIYLQGRMRTASGHSGDSGEIHPTRRLEQSLYWTCFKSECEIRVELSLPESSLAALQYPDLFPSPPNEEAVSPSSPYDANPFKSSSHFDFASPSSGSFRKRRAESVNESQKHSWYYYLTEIALRRISNRILNALYRHTNVPGHGTPVAEMMETASDFERQLEQWQTNLPSSLTFSRANLYEIPSNELAFMIRGRTLEIQSWLYRPFLYYAIHHPHDDLYRTTIEPFAHRALVCGSAYIRGLGVRHRHHGTWYELRSATAAALSILAAVKSGVLDAEEGSDDGARMGEGGWRESVKLTIEALGYWEAETLGLGGAKIVLEELLDEVEGAPPGMGTA